ncbi:hypothetical protein [Helicobacter macacae]|nr:hypothetical protein [Helicobacter macacae]
MAILFFPLPLRRGLGGGLSVWIATIPRFRAEYRNDGFIDCHARYARSQ